MTKILIIRFSSIGDIVLTTPVARSLKTQIQDSEIHYLTKKQNLPLLSANPYVDKVWLFDRNFRELIPTLKSEHFDFIADLHNNLRSLYVKTLLRRPSGTFQKLNVQKWMIVNLRINRLPHIHIVDRYFGAVKKLNIRNDNRGLDYFIPSGDEVSAASLPEPFCRGFVAFVIGGKHNTKIFPEEQIKEICHRVSKPVILLGDKYDAQRGDRIAEGSDGKVFNACGLWSINQSASIVKQAISILTNDTGLMHIAAAFGKPILSVWGNTIPDFGMYPYLEGKGNVPNMIFEVKGLSCRPCSKIGFEECPKGHFRCMRDQDTGKMIRMLNS